MLTPPGLKSKLVDDQPIISAEPSENGLNSKLEKSPEKPPKDECDSLPHPDKIFAHKGEQKNSFHKKVGRDMSKQQFQQMAH